MTSACSSIHSSSTCMERHLSEATENMDISMFPTLGVLTAILSQHSGLLYPFCASAICLEPRDPCADPQCLSGGLCNSVQCVVVRSDADNMRISMWVGPHY